MLRPTVSVDDQVRTTVRVEFRLTRDEVMLMLVHAAIMNGTEKRSAAYAEHGLRMALRAFGIEGLFVASDIVTSGEEPDEVAWAGEMTEKLWPADASELGETT